MTKFYVTVEVELEIDSEEYQDACDYVNSFLMEATTTIPSPSIKGYSIDLNEEKD